MKTDDRIWITYNLGVATIISAPYPGPELDRRQLGDVFIRFLRLHRENVRVMPTLDRFGNPGKKCGWLFSGDRWQDFGYVCTATPFIKKLIMYFKIVQYFSWKFKIQKPINLEL
jgi:hypothetical protein